MNHKMWLEPNMYSVAARVKNALSVILAMNTYDIKKIVKHYNHKFAVTEEMMARNKKHLGKGKHLEYSSILGLNFT